MSAGKIHPEIQKPIKSFDLEDPTKPNHVPIKPIKVKKKVSLSEHKGGGEGGGVQSNPSDISDNF